MKSLILWLGLALPAFVYAQDNAQEKAPDVRGIAMVARIGGLDIYMYSEPVAEYEVIDDLASVLGGLSSFTNSNVDITTIVDGFVDKCSRKNKKRKKEGEPLIEAIIIYNNEKASGIRYLTEEK